MNVDRPTAPAVHCVSMKTRQLWHAVISTSTSTNLDHSWQTASAHFQKWCANCHCLFTFTYFVLKWQWRKWRDADVTQCL